MELLRSLDQTHLIPEANVMGVSVAKLSSEEQSVDGDGWGERKWLIRNPD